MALMKVSEVISASGSGKGRPLALSRRASASPLREQIEAHIEAGEAVELDFEGVEATQSFVDELVGLIVLERGPDVLNQLAFRRCSADMKGIISFVVSDRAAQHAASPHFFAPRTTGAVRR
jgi:hypothetical protein